MKQDMEKAVETRAKEMVAQMLRERGAAGGRATASGRTAKERKKAARAAVSARWARRDESAAAVPRLAMLRVAVGRLLERPPARPIALIATESRIRTESLQGLCASVVRSLSERHRVPEADFKPVLLDVIAASGRRPRRMPSRFVRPRQAALAEMLMRDLDDRIRLLGRESHP